MLKPPRKSAVALASILLAAALAILLGHTRLLIFVLGVAISLAYIPWGALNAILMIYGLKPYYEPRGAPRSLPKISLLMPAKDEPLIGRTLEAFLNHVNYPKEKLEIVPVVDDEGTARIVTWYAQKYPRIVRPVYRTSVRVGTKPSALNDALPFTTGDIIGIVDAEDIPDRDVLRKVAWAIEVDGYDALQVMLAVNNGKASWVTAMFEIEYEAWFGLVQNGRFQLRAFVPLGGTGCFFSRRSLTEIGSWDAINVAEDAEVAVRLMLKGGRIALVKAIHWEEMPTTVARWLRQRARWFKGWIQSLAKYSLKLLSYHIIRRIGLFKAVSTLMMLFAPLIMIMNAIAYSVTALWLVTDVFRLAYPGLMSGLLPWWLIIPLAFNGIYFCQIVLGMVKTGRSLRKNVSRILPMFIIYYNGLMTLGALKALYEFLTKPAYWAKTEHPGLGVRWTLIR